METEKEEATRRPMGWPEAVKAIVSDITCAVIIVAILGLIWLMVR
jgi:hypothetical protein